MSEISLDTGYLPSQGLVTSDGTATMHFVRCSA